jgi:hypothetical protein
MIYYEIVSSRVVSIIMVLTYVWIIRPREYQVSSYRRVCFGCCQTLPVIGWSKRWWPSISENMSRDLDSSRLGYYSSRWWRDTLWALSVLRYHFIVCADTSWYWSCRYWNTWTSKEKDIGTRIAGIVIKEFASWGYRRIFSGDHMYCEVIGINICTNTRFAWSHSCVRGNHYGRPWSWCWLLIWKGFRVMFTYYQICWVKCLNL